MKLPYNNFNKIKSYWQEHGFDTWEWQGMRGVRRRVTFRKDSLLGEVAKYYADDFIVWEYENQSPGIVLKNWQPAEDVAVHRFLFLGHVSSSQPQIRSFLFGLQGWVEIYQYCIGDEGHKKFQDLVFHTDKAYELLQREGE